MYHKLRRMLEENPTTAGLEGIFDWFFGAKNDSSGKGVTETATERTEELLEWWYKNVSKVSEKDLKEPGTVTIGKRNAGCLVSEGLIDRVKADIAQYSALYNRYSVQILKGSAAMDKLRKELDVFTGDTDRYDEFKAALIKNLKLIPKPVALTFNEPNHNFLGFGNKKFLEGRGDDAEFIMAYSPPVNENDVTLPVLDYKGFKSFLVLVTSIAALESKIYNNFGDTFHGVDFSDPPFRGYIDELNEDWEELERYGIDGIYSETYDPQGPWLMEGLSSRLYSLMVSLIAYMKACVK